MANPVKSAWFKVVFMVISAFFGIRRRQDHEQTAHISPIVIILTAVGVLLFFIVGLIFFINYWLVPAAH